jgi:putative membrane protein
MIDVFLSAFHFLLVFSLVAILAVQGALIRPGITASSLRLAATLDRAYGASAVLLLGVGFSRVYWGAKGSAFYLWVNAETCGRVLHDQGGAARNV